jgi:prophage regulatory protein
MGKPDVVGVHEIAERLGVSRTRARQLVASKGFPDPCVLRMGSVWSRTDVEAWIRRNRPQLGKV